MAIPRTQIDAIVTKLQGSRDLSPGGISALKEVLNLLNAEIIDDAPFDSQQYAREDGSWTVVSGGGVEEAPNDGQSYVRKSLDWSIAASGSGLSHPATMARIGFGGF